MMPREGLRPRWPGQQEAKRAEVRGKGSTRNLKVIGAIMKRDDAGYYRTRAIQEQVAAQNSKCEAARERHEELAVMYRFRAEMLRTDRSAWADYLDDAETAAELV